MKIISLAIAIALLFTSTAYGAHLRVPLLGTGKISHIPKRNHTVNVLLKDMLKKDLEKEREDIEKIMRRIFGMEMDERHFQKKALDALIEDVSRAGEKRVGFLRIMLDLAKEDNTVDALLRKKLGSNYKELANILVTHTYVIGDRLMVWGPRYRDLGEAIYHEDAEIVREIVLRQINRNARYALVHTDGMEAYYAEGVVATESMKWVISVLEKLGVSIVIDSGKVQVLEEAARSATGKVEIILNSINAKKIAALKPVIEECREAGKNIGVVVVGTGEGAIMGPTAENKCNLVRSVVEQLNSPDRILDDYEIFFDPGIGALIKQFEEGEGEFLFTVTFDAMRNIREEFPDSQITVGVNNVSIGEPNLSLLHRIFTVICMGCGLNAPIANPVDIQLMATIEAAELLMKDWGMVEAELNRTNTIPLKDEFLDYFIEKFNPELKAELVSRGYSMYYLFNRALIPLCFILRGFRKTETGWYKLAPLEEIWHPQVDEDDEELQIVLRVVLLMLGDKNYEFYNKRKGVMSREPEHIRPYIERAKKEDLLEKLEVVRDMFDKGMLLEEEIVFLRGFLQNLIDRKEESVLPHADKLLAKINKEYPVDVAVGDYIRQRIRRTQRYL